MAPAEPYRGATSTGCVIGATVSVFRPVAGIRTAHRMRQLTERTVIMLAILSAVLFFISFLINAADISTNDTFSSTNVMLLGLTALALHVAGIGSGWSWRRR
ncbi:hypothetical protein LXH13_37515 [Streptomyces spinosirectus]|uniref:hypothetical protein n=1 Tax=Streptomyces TaxID=1883 RepID=UPI000FFED03C|nr:MULTISPECIES: hypothetical protein [Streptomyces]MBY8340996.1 hypothetical protein [Streptomyces plumbidurans]UIR23204.1 hypothetical protein LXH13_37515 [Streptomyces spinosirectus]